MPDPKVQQIKISGKFYLWSYKPEHKSNSGVHFTCSSEAIKSFDRLVKAMLESPWPNKKEIELSETSEPQKRICGVKGKSYRSLIIEHNKEFQSGTFQVIKEEFKIKLKLSSDSLELLNQCISKIEKNEGDYSIGESTPFWFWWNLED